MKWGEEGSVTIVIGTSVYLHRMDENMPIKNFFNFVNKITHRNKNKEEIKKGKERLKELKENFLKIGKISEEVKLIYNFSSKLPKHVQSSHFLWNVPKIKFSN